MLTVCESEIKDISAEIISIKNYKNTNRKLKSKIKKTLDLIDSIVQDSAVSEANLCLLIDYIVITKTDGKFDIAINI